MRIAGFWIVAGLFATTSISYSQSGYVSGRPSIDCANLSNTVALILCNVPEAARADWDVNAASWALNFNLNDTQRRLFEGEQGTWRQSLDRTCALPRYQTPEDQAGQAAAEAIGRMMLGSGFRLPGMQPITPGHVACLINAYRARAAVLRSKLKGDALTESQLSPEQHADLQRALIAKGFLHQGQMDSGAPDAEFGSITRGAIAGFQQSVGAPATGFLSDEQRSVLLESPEEREARIARAAAEEKARRDAVIAQAAEAKAKEEARIAAERQAAQAAAEEKARRDAEEARVAAEADAAKEWRRRVDESRSKGPQYAARAGINWSLSEEKNLMTDDVDYTVTSVQPNGHGAQATVEGSCQKGRVVFLATLTEAKTRDPLGLPTFDNMTTVGEKRINDEPVFSTRFHNDTFRNRILVSALTSLDKTESIETTWRVLAQIETSLGSIIVQIPTFDANVQKLMTACQRQAEMARRRGGVPDAPN
jgi:peptidoglycan hydrolase-like protein with peptidoglycan-binding domain